MIARAQRSFLPFALGAGTLVALIAIIEVLIRIGVINRFIVPMPSQIAGAFERVILEEDIPHRFLVTARDPREADSDRLEAVMASPGTAAELDTPERVLLRETLDADLQAALDDLPDAFRQAVWLRDVEEFSYAEIAAMLNVPIGTVMSRISRGRRQLFARLAKTRVAV